MRIKTSFRDAEEIMEVESYGEIQTQTRCRQRASPYLIRSKPFMLSAGVVTPIRSRWIDLVLYTFSLLLIVPGRSSPPRRTRRCRARVAMEFLFLRQPHDRLSRLLRVTRLLTVVVALKPGGCSNSRIVFWMSFAQLGGTACEVRAKATRLNGRDLNA
jgi:hypothetical protein